MSQQIRKIPLNLKLLQKNQESQSENIVKNNKNIELNLQNSAKNEQISDDFELELNEDESPFILKRKDNNDNIVQQAVSQSSFFPSQKRPSNLTQNYDSPRIENNQNVPKQRFVRKYFQQKQGQSDKQNNNGRNFTQLQTNKEKIEFAQYNRRTFNGQINLLNQKDKNPFSNNIIANIVENSSHKSNKKQKYEQKYNPAYKLDEQFIQAIKIQTQDQSKGITEEQALAQFKSQESLEGNTYVVHKLNHVHRNFKVISRTFNELDNNYQTHFNGFYDKFPKNQDLPYDQITETEQQILMDLYLKNVQNTMTECCPSNNQLKQDSSDSLIISNGSQLPQQKEKSTLFKLKSEGFINDKQQFEIQPSQENTQCSTPPQQIQQNIEVKYSEEKRQDKIKDSQKINSSQNLQNQKYKQNISLKQLNQKQYQVTFTDVQSIKNSTQEYVNIFKGGPQQYLHSNNSLKDLDEKQVNSKKENGAIFRIRQNIRNEKGNNQNSPFEMHQKKNGKELFFCSYQNIEKITQNDEDNEDFELYNYLSCNLIPDQIESNNNLDSPNSDIQIKKFIMRKIKAPDDTSRINNNIDQNKNFRELGRSSSVQGNKNLIQQCIQFREPVK